MLFIKLGLTYLWTDFISLLFPETCISCNDTLLKNENQICVNCKVNLPVTNYHLSLNDNPVYNDLKIIENLHAATAYLSYHKFGIAQKMLKQLKYKGNYEIGQLLGNWYGTHLVDNIKADVILPVPIHTSKIKQRGYNQSMAIAEGLQSALKIPIDQKSVIRTKKTLTQTKRQKVDRWHAMREVFTVIETGAIQGKDILIVDDVITTGATLFSLCHTINTASPGSLQIVAMATGK